jgi:TolB protein
VSIARPLVVFALAWALLACDEALPTRRATASPTVPASPVPQGDDQPVVTGTPIDRADLQGRIVFDDFEDVFVMDVDGSNVATVAGDPGAEFDGELSPDGKWVVYRDSTRGINENDEIFVARVDGSGRRNLTNDPANDWGPTWSPDGSTIAFNSDRDAVLAGYLINADGSNLRPIGVLGWFEYPSFSPDGTKLAFMSHHGADYDIFVADVATGVLRQLTDVPGGDGWPSWSPDGSTIAFSSHRDDCRLAPRGQECWNGDPNDEHSDIWLMDADGANQRRLTPEISQFVSWSPDGAYLLVSGHALFVVRPDGTGRLELRAEGIGRPLGGIPDWG